MVKNGRDASPATARARSVFPVPGGPTSSAPLGSRPPSRVKRDGSLRKSIVSCSSSFASSHPATSAKVTLGVSPESSFAFDFPNENAREPPACICRNQKSIRPNRKIHGNAPASSPIQFGRASSASMATPLFSSRVSRSSPASTGTLVQNSRPES